MSATTTSRTAAVNPLTAGKLPRWTTPAVLVVCLVASGALFAAIGFGVGRVLFFAVVAFTIVMMVLSSRVEGSRRAKDRLATILVTSAFVLALVPLISSASTSPSSPGRCAVWSVTAVAPRTRSPAPSG